MTQTNVVCFTKPVPPPQPTWRPQPAPWNYTPSFQWTQPFPPSQCSCSPGCGCGGGQCQMQQWQAMIKAVICDMYQQSQGGTCPSPVPGFAGPLVGVVDGSDALPGQVGEYFESQVTQTYPANSQVVPVTLGVLQPGDWNIWVYAKLSAAITGGYLDLTTPYPAWAPNGLESIDGRSGSSIGSFPQRCSVSAPTLIAVSLATNTVSSGGAGTATLTLGARRAR